MTSEKLLGIIWDDRFRDISFSHHMIRDISKERIETIIGSVITEFLMVMVEMASTGIPDSTNIYSPSDLARVFSSIAGSYSPYFFGLGLLGAGFLALVVISLGSAWGTAEALGIPRNKSYKLYLIESVPALLVTLLVPKDMLGNVVLNLLSLFVIILLGPALVMGILANNPRIMGEYKNNSLQNVVYWSSITFIFILGLLSQLS